jgi:hypothetical protein
MVFQDGSDFAPMVRSEEEIKAAVAEVSDVARDEWFVSAEVSVSPCLSPSILIDIPFVGSRSGGGYLPAGRVRRR